MKFDSLSSQGAQVLRTPGLYFESRPAALAGPRTLTGGVPAFVGLVAPHAFGREPAQLRWFDRWERFASAYERMPGMSDLLKCAVRGFFENGGARCLIVPVRLHPEDGDAPSARAARLCEPFAAGGVLEAIEDIDLVCVPEATGPALSDQREAVLAVQTSAAVHCERMGNRFAVLDAISADDQDLSDALDAVIGQWQTLPGEHGALYFPWIGVKPLASPSEEAGAKEGAQTGPRATITVPPCGHIAGVYARSDQRVGVFKPPANEELEGALDLAFDLTDAQQAALNQAGVNCLRDRPGRGLRVWGARTLSSRRELRYVHATRLVLAVRRELDQHLRDLTFEPNDTSLWDAVTGRLTGYFSDLFHAGALKGREPDEAYFVQCDAETNPADAREAGRVNAVAGFAPAAPTEFVIVRITQSADGVSVITPDVQS